MPFDSKQYTDSPVCDDIVVALMRAKEAIMQAKYSIRKARRHRKYRPDLK